MSELKYKVGDKVRIKSIDWYNENKDEYGYIDCGSRAFFIKMSDWCGKIATIKEICKTNCYHLEEYDFDWTDEMIEGLVEDDIIDIDEFQDDNEIIDIIDEYVHYLEDNECQIHLPEGYQFTDENGNIINTTRIVLEKKNNDKLKLESTKKVREYWSEYTRIFIEIYDDNPNVCILTHLYTLEKYRQKGYAREALAEAELIAKELGCHTAYLKVETNSWMYRWYLRCGYNWNKPADEGYTWLTKNL